MPSNKLSLNGGDLAGSGPRRSASNRCVSVFSPAVKTSESFSWTPRPLPLSFFKGSTRALAKKLLGHVLCCGGLQGRIVETEAYLANDPASHSFGGRTDRNAAMFLEAGHCYVYRIYGIHRCVNVVTRPEGIGEAVLIRAVEPLHPLPDSLEDSVSAFWLNRYGTRPPSHLVQELENGNRGLLKKYINLCNGPGKLCAAMKIGVNLHDGLRLDSDEIQLRRGRSIPAQEIESGPRIGISPGKNHLAPWRYVIKGSPYLSR